VVDIYTNSLRALIGVWLNASHKWCSTEQICQEVMCNDFKMIGQGGTLYSV